MGDGQDHETISNQRFGIEVQKMSLALLKLSDSDAMQTIV